MFAQIQLLDMLVPGDSRSPILPNNIQTCSAAISFEMGSNTMPINRKVLKDGYRTTLFFLDIYAELANNSFSSRLIVLIPSINSKSSKKVK